MKIPVLGSLQGSSLTRFRLAIGGIRCLSSRCTIPLDYDATKYRQWITIKPCVNEESTVSVMSFNLLLRHYMWKEVFSYLDQAYLDWGTYRFPLINKTIEQFQSDIMCFQEMEHSIYERYWSKNFPNSSYKSIYMRKSKPRYWGDKPLEHIDGVSIFVNCDKFDIIKQEKVHFGEFILKNKHSFSLTDDLTERVVSRNTVGILVKLKHKVTNKFIYVVNTHLYWSPKYNDVKLVQTKILLNLLNNFIDTADPSVILMGDLNSTPESSVFQLLNEGMVNLSKAKDLSDVNYGKGNSIIDQQGCLQNPFLFENVYSSLLDTDNLEFTSFTKSLTDVLDHIWVSKNHFSVLKVLSEVDKSYSNDLHTLGFPNNEFPSDHIPLVAQLSVE